MKLASPAFIALALTAFTACSKSSDIAPPADEPYDPISTAPTADTLTTGWTKSAAGTNTISDIFFLNASVGYVSAKSIYKTVNGGVTWDSVYTVDDGSTNLAVAPDGNLFFVGTLNMNVYKSLDAAKTFTTTPLGASGSSRLSDIYFAGNDTGYTAAYSGSLYRTIDGGKTWSDVSKIAATRNTQYRSVFFINGSTGWVSVGGELYKTSGDINAWSKCTLNGLTSLESSLSIHAPSSAVVYLGYPGKVLKSTDGGVTFSVVKQFSDKPFFTDVHFITESMGYVSHGYRLYKTTDGGASWQTVATTTKILVEIHFTDASHGWACGMDGMTLRYNL